MDRLRDALWLALLAITAGCLSGQEEARGDLPAARDCDVQEPTTPIGTAGLHLHCTSVTGAHTLEHAQMCTSAPAASLHVGQSIASGQARIQLLDGAGNPVVDKATGPPYDDEEEHDLTGAVPGTWVVRVATSRDFQGAFEVELVCTAV